MAFDEGLAERLREIFAEREDISEKRMFGGLAFMLDGNMFVGIIGENLMARVGLEGYAEMLRKKHVRKMDFTGKPLKGYVYVEPEGYESDTDLLKWVGTCMKFASTLPKKKPRGRQ